MASAGSSMHRIRDALQGQLTTHEASSALRSSLPEDAEPDDDVRALCCALDYRPLGHDESEARSTWGPFGPMIERTSGE